jgi:hypothetical protein
MFPHRIGSDGVLLIQPASEQIQRVIPERIEFYSFSASRRHNPVINFSVHPGELIALFPLTHEAVNRIYTDIEVRTLEVMINDGNQFWQNCAQRLLVLCNLQIAV